MAVYSKLLLSTGGGIVSLDQQADQVANTATILVGLGGTGVSAIRAIKTEVYARLKPDNAQDIKDGKSNDPKYSHIQFLGVDTDSKSKGGTVARAVDDDTAANQNRAESMPLDDSEFLDIGGMDVASLIENPQIIRNHRPDLAWLNFRQIKPTTISAAGAGGNRQVGRVMLLDKSQKFMEQLTQKIIQAKTNLGSGVKVYIHIFAGLSGGTGSGCFLDACYMAKSVSGDADNVFGYFFLPDVNLSIIPFSDTQTRDYIPKNGYAAMQELDYCMNLPQNGGSFTQLYKQGNQPIAWNKPPVNMCHLICATDQGGKVIPNAYDYAMHVSAEYIMDFLTAADGQGLESIHSNFISRVSTADGRKTFGANMAYCAIGASCASLPLREINTYLASELFDKFSEIQGRKPTEGEVMKALADALAPGKQSLNEVYEALLQEIAYGASNQYDMFPGDWKEVLDYRDGGSMTDGVGASGGSGYTDHYVKQLADKIGVIEANVKSMTDDKNEESLIGRIRKVLLSYILDLKKGPMFAYGILDAGTKNNMLNLIDGLIEQNKRMLTQEISAKEQAADGYHEARDIFFSRIRRGMFDKDVKRYADFEGATLYLIQLMQSVEIYEKLGALLEKFRKQVSEAATGYYLKLSRVTGNLLDTFRENRNWLIGAQADNAEASFAQSLVSISDLRETLNQKIQALDIPNMMRQFMELLVDNESKWLDESENKISRLVIQYFTKTAFNDFAGMTITDYLRDKYQRLSGEEINDGILTKKVHDDWFVPLTENASPLFFFDKSVWKEDATGRLRFVSFPRISNPIKEAANQLNSAGKNWELKPSALTDRIYVLSCATGFPIGSYANCKEYERSFFTSHLPGSHYYEGMPQEGLSFNDWNALPSLTPYSHLIVESLPEEMRRRTMAAADLYESAKVLHVIDESGKYSMVDVESAQKLTKAVADCTKAVARASKPSDTPILESALETIEQLDLSMKPTGFQLPVDGNRDTANTIRQVEKDYFISSPATHEAVRQAVDQVKPLSAARSKAIAELKDKIRQIQSFADIMEDYCNAVFYGVIVMSGKKVIYRKEEFGLVSEVVLSQVPLDRKSGEFRFYAIPLYQGFLSYQAMDQEDRDQIAQLIAERMNDDSSALGSQLKVQFADNVITAWMQLAANYQERAEIVAFLTDFVRRFKTYCLSMGL